LKLDNYLGKNARAKRLIRDVRHGRKSSFHGGKAVQDIKITKRTLPPSAK